MLATTGIYAALLGILMIGLSTAVSVRRGKTGISLLHGDDLGLAEQIRRHGNFTESVPLALLLMGIVEAMGASGAWLHAIGITLLAARIVHPFGIKHDRAASPMRIIGGSGTQLSMLIAISYILGSAVLG